MATLAIPLTVWTIGHSTHPIAEFLEILERNEIEALADIRRFPGSRRQPQFHAGVLEDSLAGAGIAYLPLASLGGRRDPAPDSPNTGWRHRAFRGYADHVASDEFADGLMELLMAAHGLRTAIMCAEVLWWRCHRRLVADVLVSLGADVVHIMGAAAARPHRIAAPARLTGGVLGYPGQG